MTDTLTYTGDLVVRRCWCGIRHAIPSELNRQAGANQTFVVWCPLGHEGVRKTSDADALRAQLDQAQAAKREAERRADAAREEARAERLRTTAAVTEVNRTRKRLAGGACPCCNRSFTNLSRHVRGQHPEYVDAMDLPADIVRWSLVDAVTRVLEQAGEPMRPAAVLGRLVVAGRRRDTEKTVQSALYNAERTRSTVARVARNTWAAS